MAPLLRKNWCGRRSRVGECMLVDCPIAILDSRWYLGTISAREVCVAVTRGRRVGTIPRKGPSVHVITGAANISTYV